jgi:hypothetical protein
LIRESEITAADRPPEYLKQTWDKKWESMDFTWFQQHKHLGPNEKKKEASQKYHDQFIQYLMNSLRGPYFNAPPARPMQAPQGTGGPDG